MQTVIFLGAGASKADGAPLQKDLFSVYFQMIRRRHPVDEMEHELMDYFDLVFGLDCRHADPAALSFPTFEEAIGIVDLALARGESLREFSILNRATNSNRLGFIRLYLILMLASVLHARLDGQNVHHRRLIRKLRRMKRLDTTAFVSTNYDILIDNALMEAYPHRTLDYGIDFANFDKPDDWGSDVLGPMGREFIPLATKSDANEFLRDHDATGILRFADVSPKVVRDVDEGRR